MRIKRTLFLNQNEQAMNTNIHKSQRKPREQFCTFLITDDPSYTGCPRRNVPDFGRAFLMLKYTDITQNTYIQS
jgi:hypothetical protein